MIDAHCHVASTKFIPRQFFEGVAANMAASLPLYGVGDKSARVLELLLEQHQDHEADELVAAMDAAGVERAVLLAPDFSYVMKAQHTVAEVAELHARIRQKHPGRFLVFIGVDPRWGSDGVALFQTCIEKYQFEGLKLYPPCGYSPSDPSLLKFYEICDTYRLPVLLHTGPTSPALSFEEASPGLVDRAARMFANVPFILAHGAVTNVEATLQQCAYRPNVFCDVSGFASLGRPADWTAHLRGVFSRGLNHKIIFGTDWPVFRGKGDHVSMVRQFCASDGPMSQLPKREREAILGKNIERLLSGRPSAASGRRVAA